MEFNTQNTKQQEQQRINEQDKQNRDRANQSRSEYINKVEGIADGLKKPMNDLSDLLNEGIQLMSDEDRLKYKDEVSKAQDAMKKFGTIGELIKQAKAKL